MPRAAIHLLMADHTTSKPAMDFQHLSSSPTDRSIYVGRSVVYYRSIRTTFWAFPPWASRWWSEDGGFCPGGVPPVLLPEFVVCPCQDDDHPGQQKSEP
jgi:hypothetical protein